MHGRRVAEDMPLTVTLEYKNLPGLEVRGKNDSNILTIVEPSETAIVKGIFECRLRIEEVSRSHKNQLFVVRLHPAQRADVEGVCTSEIKVLSKQTIASNKTRVRARGGEGLPPAKKLTSPGPSGQLGTDLNAVPHALERVSPSSFPQNHELSGWCKRAAAILFEVEWQAVGVRACPAAGNEVIIYMCASCKGMWDIIREQSERKSKDEFHFEDCKIYQAKRDFERIESSMNQTFDHSGWPASSFSDSNGRRSSLAPDVDSASEVGLFILRET
jgi:hypothetical protein